ncbi:hypothetical protein, partial [Pelotomaculum sp. FP]|uniref:hypothetical protein n=1 Tax=Pelotomaculum sp. FP TaxID=261474 RepID=UPI001961136F
MQFLKFGLKPNIRKFVTCLAVLAVLSGLLGMAAPGPASALIVPGLSEVYITTVAGNGSSGISGDGGPAVEAALNLSRVAVDSAGNLYIAGNYWVSGNNRVRMVAAVTGKHYGIPMTAGNIYTVAVTGAAGGS